MVVVTSIDLHHALAGVREPGPTHAGLPVARKLEHAVLAGRGGREHLTEPVGRNLDADAALRFGLVMDVVDDPLNAAHGVVDRITRQAPLAVRLSKTVIDAPGDHAWATDVAQAVLFDTDDKRTRMTNFLERKK